MTDKTHTTTNTGIPVSSDEFSKTIGPDGPVVLHDVYLVEKLAQFNRERVPERVVHAKGGGAFGTLKVTHDVSGYTRAALFQPGAETEMLIRFSSVAGELGSPDTWRDVRGFALKFYTSEGNYDIVGNNTPVFFIRDGIKFPDFIRSQKRLPDTNLRDADMQWDFWTLSPESAHQVTYLMGDRGLPKSWRLLNGYGSHTYQWINASGEKFWVKYHFHNQQGGAINIGADEAEKIVGEDTDYYLRDLFEAIERGEFPKWTVSVQIMPYEDAKTYRFNPFDLTKVWPHADYPLIPVGEFELNRNPGNYFTEIEQAAFAPSNLVPGIGPSPDKMLLARIFSYADAHRYRIGTNYNELPVNRPRTEVNSYSKAGAVRHFYNDPKLPVYAPNSFGGPAAEPARAEEGSWQTDGDLVRSAYTLRSDDDDFGQAGTLVREVFDDAQRDRLVDTLVGQYNSLKHQQVRERFLWYWTNIDANTAERIKARVGAAQAAE